MAFAFRRAARATALTSSTTCAAFFANMFNPLMPFASFGIYAGVLVVSVYGVVVLAFPPIMIV